MKLHSVFAVVLLGDASAFSPTVHPQILSTTALSAVSGDNENTMTRTSFFSQAAGLMGSAGIVLAGSDSATADSTTLDFSLPKYDTKMSGFGDGAEAILNSKGRADRTDPGSNEKEKQLESMRLADEARLAAKEKKKAEMKALEEESKRRAQEKKARDAERLKNIWNS